MGAPRRAFFFETWGFCIFGSERCWYDSPQVNPILLYFASGESLYSGAAPLLVTVAISPHLTHRRPLRLRNIVTWLALAMIVMACPPFSWIIDAMFGVVFFLWFVAWNKTPERSWTGFRVATMAVLLVVLLALAAMELRHRRMPTIEGEPSDHLVVIGDSISAGLDARVAPWPAIMERATGVQVRNLSRPGATMTDGLALADGVTHEDHLILIELGGNDLIAGGPSDVFARELEALLAKLAVSGRTVVMFELPLLPFRIAYGQIQRRLAAKYGVPLIPKRYLTGVIAGKDATLDGLHLTDAGARRMALVVAQALSPVLRAQFEKPTTPATHP
jgi:lysophospholipase L1-like esterase